MATTTKKKVDFKIKIRIKLSAYDHSLLDKYSQEIAKAVDSSGSRFSGPVPLPTILKKWDALKSPFVYKNHFDQFEMRIHRRLIDIFDPTPNMINTLQKLDVPAGVEAEIKMVQ